MLESCPDPVLQACFGQLFCISRRASLGNYYRTTPLFTHLESRPIRVEEVLIRRGR